MPRGGRYDMHPDLERTRETIVEATQGMDAARLAAHPPGKWSSADILEHLSKAYASTAYILDRCLVQGVPKARAVTWRDRLAAFVVVTVGYFPSGVQAPELTRPTGQPGVDAVAAAESALRRLDDAAARAEARFGTGVRLANHPILGPFTVGQWRRFHLVHTRHHAKQIAARRRAAAG